MHKKYLPNEHLFLKQKKSPRKLGVVETFST